MASRWFCSSCKYEAVSHRPLKTHPRCPNGHDLIERNPNFEIPKRRAEPVVIDLEIS